MPSFPAIHLALSLRDFRRTWPQLVLIHLLSVTLIVVAITPLVTGLIKLFLIIADEGVLTDADIAVFLLHPIGLLALVVVGSIFLGVFFVQQGALMVIGYGAVEDRRVTWHDAVRYVAVHARSLTQLGLVALVRLVFVATPFIAVIGGIYLVFLGEYDINYYLAHMTSDMVWALVLGAIVAAAFVMVVLRLLAGWLLALPLTLFENVGGREALRESVRRSRDYAWGITLWLAVWLAILWVVSGAVTLLVSVLGSLLVPTVSGDNFPAIAVGLAFTLLLAALANLAVNIFIGSVFPFALVRLYRSFGAAGQLVPPPSERGSLGDRPSFQIPGMGILWAAGAVLVAVNIAGYLAFLNISADDEVIVIAHRGASGAAPENTLAAIEEAIQQSSDWIEIDVQENAEGLVIVAHDSDFMKVARNRLKVWNATSEELRHIDIGSWFAPEFSGERTPTLRQALELAHGRAGMLIELKYYDQDQQLESRVADVVESTGMTSNVMLMSLKRKGIEKFASLRPNWPHGLLSTASVGDLTRLKVDFLALNANSATQAMIRRAHQRGMKVYVWTVNDPIHMSVLISRGVDGIITDEPGLARRVLEVREGLSLFGRLVVWIAGETGLLRVDEQASTEDDA